MLYPINQFDQFMAQLEDELSPRQYELVKRAIRHAEAAVNAERSEDEQRLIYGIAQHFPQLAPAIIVVAEHVNSGQCQGCSVEAA